MSLLMSLTGLTSQPTTTLTATVLLFIHIVCILF